VYFWYKLSIDEAAFNGKKISKRYHGGYIASRTDGSGTMGSEFPSQKPGHYKACVTPNAKILYGTMHREKSSVVCYENKITLEAEFDVLKTEPQQYIKLIDDPSLKDDLLKIIRPQDFSLRNQELSGYIVIEGMLPVNLAFDVIAKIGDMELVLGSNRSARPKINNHWNAVQTKYKGPQFKSFDIILRSSKEAAKDSVDLFEIWDGELIYENVPVKVKEE